MDEIQFEESLRKILESILREKRNRRLTQAGLPSSDNTVISPRSDRQEGHSSNHKFANLTFTRGNTLKPSESQGKYDLGKIPGGRMVYDDAPIVAIARDLPRATGWYRVAGELDDIMYAEIRTKDNPEYQYMNENPPDVPSGYVGNWFIMDE